MDSVYIIENGLRRVKPYYFEYRTLFKPRWAGQTVKHILCKELGQTESVVDKSIDNGKISIQMNTGKAGGPITLHYEQVKNHLLRPHDVVLNLQHMHEPSVIWEGKNIGGGGLIGDTFQESILRGNGICVIFENDDFVVVNKPSGIATHPGGIYRQNTMSEIIKNELGYEAWPCHRLDKGTLGVLVLAKNKESNAKMMSIILDKSDLTQKHYVARVKGKFTSDVLRYTCPVFTVNSSSGYINVPNASNVSARSTTEIERVQYFPESDESIVKCRPISGKMHQIRVHLRNLGFPISNDPLFNPTSEVNQTKNTIEKEIYSQIFKMWPSLGSSNAPEYIDIASCILDEIRDKMTELATMRLKTVFRTEECSECGRSVPVGVPDSGIYLHAYRLKHNGDVGFNFHTLYPEWCGKQGIQNE